MKKKMFLFLLMMFVMPLSVMADQIYSIDMKINILEDGTANIVEVWDVKADSGSEWYKTMYELNNSKLSNYKVLKDGRELLYKDYWNVDGTMRDKDGYYGINNTSQGIELCFGKGDYKRHKYTVSYTLSNYVFNVSDAQVLAWVLFPKIDTDYFSAVISSYYKFPDSLDVWGYGYKGYAYVEDGLIKVSSEDGLNNDYVSLLVKFPLNTFNTLNRDLRYSTFNDVYNVAEEGTFEYDYDYSYETKVNLFDVLMMLVSFLLPFLVVIVAFIISFNNGYGYKDNKKIDKKSVPMFRDIPCNKDIYYANALIKLNSFDYKESNIFGAIILKWVRENKIGFKNETKGLFNKETSVIDLTMNPSFDNLLESELFDIMYEASKDGFLEAKELERWSRKNYSKFFDLFKDIENNKIDELERSGHIYDRISRQECKKKNVMDDTLYNDSIQLYGLKKYLEEFSRMDTKEVMEVKLWDEYLMFAYLFGIADKVAKQLKDMYPEVVLQMEQSNFDYDTLIFINNMSVRSVNAASSARTAASNYSGGGGGFSSGGGGGFSGGFSGGGGGSAGGR